jgi:hypothetical protein
MNQEPFLIKLASGALLNLNNVNAITKVGPNWEAHLVGGRTVVIEQVDLDEIEKSVTLQNK